MRKSRKRVPKRTSGKSRVSKPKLRFNKKHSKDSVNKSMIKRSQNSLAFATPREMEVEEAEKCPIKVYIRLRPIQAHEKKLSGNRKCIRTSHSNIKTIEYHHNGKSTPFSFDRVFPEQSQQTDIFNNSDMKQLLNLTLDGYSTTIFAYGITGSGKTYTMLGPESFSTDGQSLKDDEYGIAPRGAKYICKQLEERARTTNMSKQYKTTYNIDVCFLEIYNNKVNDLLNLATGLNLPVRQSNKFGFYVENQFIVNCKTFDDVMSVLREGCKNRTVAEHKMNIYSSRSHSIFTLYVEMKTVDIVDGFTTKKRGKVSFCDLAGSERLKKSQSKGTHKKETGFINSSLLTLCQVISALSQNKSIKHVPYRNSKLTQLLMDSLGGETRTLLISTITPAETHFDETLNTLKYASSAKKIKTRPTKNVQRSERDYERLHSKVLEMQAKMNVLEKENKELKSRGPSRSGSGSRSGGLHVKPVNTSLGFMEDADKIVTSLVKKKEKMFGQKSKRKGGAKPKSMFDPKYAKVLAEKEFYRKELDRMQKLGIDEKEISESVRRKMKAKLDPLLPTSDVEVLKNKNLKLIERVNSMESLIKKNLKGDRLGLELLNYANEPDVIFTKLIDDNKVLRERIKALEGGGSFDDEEVKTLRNEITYLTSILEENNITYKPFMVKEIKLSSHLSYPSKRLFNDIGSSQSDSSMPDEGEGEEKRPRKRIVHKKKKPKKQKLMNLPAPVGIQKRGGDSIKDKKIESNSPKKKKSSRKEKIESEEEVVEKVEKQKEPTKSKSPVKKRKKDTTKKKKGVKSSVRGSKRKGKKKNTKRGKGRKSISKKKSQKVSPEVIQKELSVKIPKGKGKNMKKKKNVKIEKWKKDTNEGVTEEVDNNVISQLNVSMEEVENDVVKSIEIENLDNFTEDIIKEKSEMKGEVEIVDDVKEGNEQEEIKKVEKEEVKEKEEGKVKEEITTNELEVPKNESDTQESEQQNDEPKEDSEQPKEDSEKPKEDSEQPKGDSEEPNEDSEEPKGELGEDSEQPKEDLEELKEDSEQLKEDSKEPKGDSEEPKGDSEEPKGDSKEPKEDSEQPKEEEVNSKEKEVEEDPKSNVEEKKEEEEIFDSNEDVKINEVPEEKKDVENEMGPEISEPVEEKGEANHVEEAKPQPE